MWTLYGLHYRSFEDVDDRWEWEPSLLGVHSRLESVFDDALRATISMTLRQQDAEVRTNATPGGDDFPTRFFDLVSGFDGPQLATWVHTSASADQIRDLLKRRSSYQLKEADPHTWVIPCGSQGSRLRRTTTRQLCRRGHAAAVGCRQSDIAVVPSRALPSSGPDAGNPVGLGWALIAHRIGVTTKVSKLLSSDAR